MLDEDGALRPEFTGDYELVGRNDLDERQAGIDRARALVACTSNDALNLEIGLMAQDTVERRRADRPLRLVLRCFDPELARRIHAVSDDYILLSEAQITAPLFVQRAIENAIEPEELSPADEDAAAGN